MMPLIRELEGADADAMAALYGACFPDNWEASFFRERLESTCLAYGAFQGDMLLGFVFAQLIDGESEILTFCVDEACRGQGLGKKVLEKMLQQSKIQKCFLEVKSNNAPARALYERQGFVRTGMRKGYYKDSTQGTQDAIIYGYSKK